LYQTQPYELTLIDFNGNLHQMSLLRQDMSVPRRFTAMRDELRDQGLLKIFPFGVNELLYIPSSMQVHQYTTDKLRENEYHLVEGHFNRSGHVTRSTAEKESNVTD